MSYDNYNDESESRPAAKSGMSTGVKVLIGLLIGGGILSLICCGVGIYVFNKAKEGFKMTEAPAEVREITSEIVTISIPDQFQPKMAMKFEIFGVGMKMAVYTGATENSMVMLMENKQPAGADPQDQMDAFEEQLRQQGQAGEIEREELEEEVSEEREFTIRGNPVNFEFVTGKSPGTDEVMHQISGGFTTPEGMVVIMIQVPDDEYDEDAIVNMIESIE